MPPSTSRYMPVADRAGLVGADGLRVPVEDAGVVEAAVVGSRPEAVVAVRRDRLRASCRSRCGGAWYRPSRNVSGVRFGPGELEAVHQQLDVALDDARSCSASAAACRTTTRAPSTSPACAFGHAGGDELQPERVRPLLLVERAGEHVGVGEHGAGHHPFGEVVLLRHRLGEVLGEDRVAGEHDRGRAGGLELGRDGAGVAGERCEVEEVADVADDGRAGVLAGRCRTSSHDALYSPSGVS